MTDEPAPTPAPTPTPKPAAPRAAQDQEIANMITETRQMIGIAQDDAELVALLVSVAALVGVLDPVVVVVMVAVLPTCPESRSTSWVGVSVRSITTARRKMVAARMSSMAKPMAAPAPVTRRRLRLTPPWMGPKREAPQRLQNSARGSFRARHSVHLWKLPPLTVLSVVPS